MKSFLRVQGGGGDKTLACLTIVIISVEWADKNAPHTDGIRRILVHSDKSRGGCVKTAHRFGNCKSPRYGRRPTRSRIRAPKLIPCKRTVDRIRSGGSSDKVAVDVCLGIDDKIHLHPSLRLFGPIQILIEREPHLIAANGCRRRCGTNPTSRRNRSRLQGLEMGCIQVVHPRAAGCLIKTFVGKLSSDRDQKIGSGPNGDRPAMDGEPGDLNIARAGRDGIIRRSAEG